VCLAAPCRLLLIQRGGRTTYFGDLGKESCHLVDYLQAVPGERLGLAGRGAAAALGWAEARLEHSAAVLQAWWCGACTAAHCPPAPASRPSALLRITHRHLVAKLQRCTSTALIHHTPAPTAGVSPLKPGYNPATWMLEVTGGAMSTITRTVDMDWPAHYADSSLAKDMSSRADQLVAQGAKSAPQLQLASEFAQPFGVQVGRAAARSCL
jgi:hypothetical protein